MAYTRNKVESVKLKNPHDTSSFKQPKDNNNQEKKPDIMLRRIPMLRRKPEFHRNNNGRNLSSEPMAYGIVRYVDSEPELTNLIYNDIV
ncbi:hypothetical protein L1887_06126 [Cichorium endivia]|nr:hypothetical protein L1887_06126 [Cichorium endivia]